MSSAMHKYNVKIYFISPDDLSCEAKWGVKE